MNLSELDLDSALAHFGLTSFRPGQREVISAIVSGNDCMCVMPTGGGKSLCYQLPAVIRPGLTIVVSPLIALMKDQVDALGQKGIPAALINSTLSLGEQAQRLQDVASGKYKLVYVAPERLRSNRFLDAIRATPIQLLAIDEAHCISQWGHDFRPDYARLGRFREWLGDVQTVALTATATPRVREDIVQVLRLRRPKQFMSGFARPNLDLGVVQRQTDREKDEQLEQYLKREPGSGIIYAATRKRCDSLVEMIQKKLKVPVGAYHAGMLPEQRRAIQERFMKNELRIIVATNAFGMGIDKPDLRFVIHYNIPGSLEAYYQEAGRAGRDGRQSQCVLLYSFQDRYIQEFFIDNNYPPREVIEAVYDFLCEREEDPIELTHEQIRDALGLSISGEAIGSSLQILARTDVIERLETGGGLAKIRIDSELPTLVDMLPKDATVKRKVMRAIEHMIGARRGEDVFVHPRWLMQELQMDRDNMNRNLRELAAKLPPVDYVPPFRGRATHFLKRDVPFKDLEIDFAALAKRKEAEYERLNQVVRYAQTPRCRQAAILDYFGDTDAADCGHCDRCLGAQGWPHLAQRMRGGGTSADSSPTTMTETASPLTEVGWIPKRDSELADSRTEAKATNKAEKKGSAKAEKKTTASEPKRSDLQPAASNEPRPGGLPHSSASELRSSEPDSRRESGLADGELGSAELGQELGHGESLLLVPLALRPLLIETIAAIDRTHGRLGKILVGQFLCGSNNAKVQKLRLHRLTGFGLLESLRQSDAMELIDALQNLGLLQQQEVNRHRPTISLSDDVRSGKVNRVTVLQHMRLTAGLIKRLTEVAKRASEPTGSQSTMPAGTHLPQGTLSPGGTLDFGQPPSGSAATGSNSNSSLANRSHDQSSSSASMPATNLTTRQTPNLTPTQVPTAVASPNAVASPRDVPVAADDWSWTWQLLVDGYGWGEVMAIRRRSDLEVAADLQLALRQNKTVQRQWLVAREPQDGPHSPTPG
ncbi:MAG: RecQ family ATP-dependent DNA helicase, partial [Pirellulaceae bacterium]|nr:RecQ family ATP-dependent DNA helicase [Pirellulaceae bacterium]